MKHPPTGFTIGRGRGGRRSADTLFGSAIDRKAKPPETSWWAVRDRSDFMRAHQEQLPRILRNNASVIPDRVGEPVTA